MPSNWGDIDSVAPTTVDLPLPLGFAAEGGELERSGELPAESHGHFLDAPERFIRAALE